MAAYSNISKHIHPSKYLQINKNQFKKIQLLSGGTLWNQEN